MPLETKDIYHVAHLARIAISDKECENMTKDLDGILHWFAQLNEVDVSGIPPMTCLSSQQGKLREDRVTDGGYAEKIVDNAPMSEDHFFVVPSVL